MRRIMMMRRALALSLALLMAGLLCLSLEARANFAIFQTANPVVMALVGGQSNVGGGGNVGIGNLPAHLQTADPLTYIWTQTGVAGGPGWNVKVSGTNTASWIYNNTFGGNPLTVWGPEAEFAYRFRQDFPTTPLYIVKYYESGTSLAARSASNWAPTETGKLFEGMETQAAAAKAAMPFGSPYYAYLLWMQGEEDANNATFGPAYATNLPLFITATRSRWGDARLKIAVGRITTAFAFSTDVRAAQDAAASATVKVINTDAYPLQGDGVHYTADGQVSLGGDMYTALVP